MKILVLIHLIVAALPLSADEIEIDLSQFGEPIEIAINSEAEETKPETELDREIEAFRTLHGAHNAILINNSAGRALNQEGKVIGSEGLGTPVNPQEVLIIARAMVADPVVKLYMSIKKIPDSAHTVRILYTESPDRSESSLLGYTIENPEGVYTKLVKYDGKTPWLGWITGSFEKDDREQAVTGQPASRPESKSESGGKPQSEAEGAVGSGCQAHRSPKSDITNSSMLLRFIGGESVGCDRQVM